MKELVQLKGEYHYLRFTCSVNKSKSSSNYSSQFTSCVFTVPIKTIWLLIWPLLKLHAITGKFDIFRINL